MHSAFCPWSIKGIEGAEGIPIISSNLSRQLPARSQSSRAETNSASLSRATPWVNKYLMVVIIQLCFLLDVFLQADRISRSFFLNLEQKLTAHL